MARAAACPVLYKVWIDNPALVKAADPLGRHFTPGASSLSEREREIAVLVITSQLNSDYPVTAHEKRGKEVGLPADAVEAIIGGRPTSFSDAREQTVYEVALALAGDGSCHKGCTTARSRCWAMSASPT